MKVLLISANTERISMPTIPIGLGMVAAALRQAGHQVEFLDLLDAADVPAAVAAAVERARPEAIGISIRNIDDQDAQHPRFLLERAKEAVAACRAHAGAPIVLGGAGYSIFPQAALDYLGADYGIRGDGEAAFPELLECLAAGRDPRGIAGVHRVGRTEDGGRARTPDLDRSPLWDPALDAYAERAKTEEIWVPVQSRRGCPNDCSYCSTALIQGRTLRCRRPGPVVAHIAALARRGFTRFWFVDNNFNVPEAVALELCAGLAALPVKVSWRAILYPHDVSEELVRAMAGAGCAEASVGFESGADPILRSMNKHFTAAEARRTLDLLERHGLRRVGFLLLGGPGETRETVEQSIAFVRSLRLDALRVTVGIRVYPDTPLARRAVADGMIGAGDDLLRPRFYLAPGLEPWIHEAVAGLATFGKN
jgi:radical SAM superfamily enzyme YgiQ (UPF0313 family)